jgi:hypothetical protein
MAAKANAQSLTVICNPSSSYVLTVTISPYL